jgi:signal transduction histidine kinase/CheY-like chemotaxis protein
MPVQASPPDTATVAAPIAGRRLQRLLRSVPEVAATRDLDGLAEVACRAARELVGASHAAFALREDDRCRHIQPDGERVFAEGETPLEASLAGRAMLANKPIASEGRGDRSENTGLAADVRAGTLYAVPAVRDDAIAAIVVGWSRRREIPETATVLLSALADSCAVALENLLLVEQLERRVEARTRALRQARDDAEAANRAKTAFLTNMSHELRTPLNAILGFAQILERDPTLGRPQAGRVGSIRRSGEHLLTLINDLLDMARIEAGRFELVDQDFLLGPLLDDLAEVFEARAAQRGLSFEHRTTAELPVAVRGDPTRLRQVLMNLLGNAVKFTQEGGITLSVRWLAGRLWFEVEDTGPGIDPDELPTIFEAFTQVGDRRRFSEGTGLGLPISSELIRRMGGSLQVESEPGEGSRFRCEVPLQAVEAAAALAEPEAAAFEVTGYEGPRRRVLIVDDQEENRALLVSLLVPLGLEAEQARDGQEALELLDAGDFDLVLLDLVMPRLDGFELLDAIRTDPRREGLPAIAISASVSPRQRAVAEEAGADAFLPKPVDLDDLLELIGRLLELKWQVRPAPTRAASARPAGASEGDAVLDADLGHLLSCAARSGDVVEVRRLLEGARGDDGSPLFRELFALAAAYELDQLAVRVEAAVAGG